MRQVPEATWALAREQDREPGDDGDDGGNGPEDASADPPCSRNAHHNCMWDREDGAESRSQAIAWAFRLLYLIGEWIDRRALLHQCQSYACGKGRSSRSLNGFLELQR